METLHPRKLNYGECRCCLSKGNHMNMTNEYYYNGIREVFADIFMECFNLCLSTNSDLSMLICSSCVGRLQDASSFRMMVVSNERQLLDALVCRDNKHNVFVNVPTMSDADYENDLNAAVKEEPPEIGQLEYFECDSMIKDCDAETYVEGEKTLLSRFAQYSLKPLPTKEQLHTICPNYAKKLKLLQGMIVKPSEIKRLLISTETKVDEKPKLSEKYGQIMNTNTILEFSNAVPFKSRTCAGFSCFYCPLVLESLTKLREHSAEHNKTKIRKILNTYTPYRLVVNVDVTDLKCSMCDEAVSDVNMLKIHLSATHNKEFYEEFTDRVIPFKSVNNIYECQVCASHFETFSSVERHMNIHYKNYLCSECGMGFVTQYRLKIHSYYKHGEGTFPCDQCNKVLTTKQKLKTHVNIRHNMLKRFKCTNCAERFTEYFHRQKHMSEVHGIAAIQFKCNVCEKLFDRRYALSRHTKRNHSEERDHHCILCTYKCFTLNELRLHMIKHSGEKKFECTICKKSLSRKKSLKEHMKIHNNDRRFICAFCGQAFVQKCSLKRHMKTHHFDIEYKVN